MKIAYLDCSSGISGDMFVGALIDAGVPLSHIERELSRINIKGYTLSGKNVKRCGIRARKFNVRMGEVASKAKKWEEVRELIRTSGLKEDIKDKALQLFLRLFEVEANIHGKTKKTVHLHELGAVDCIVDICSVLVGLAYLGIDRLYCSPINVGSGSIRTEHGIFPVPAPATIALLKNAVICSSGVPHELTTPTGALLVSLLSVEFGSMPEMKVSGIGYGAGDRDLKGTPNVARLIVGDDGIGEGYEEIFVIEANIDDMNPQFFSHVMDKLFQSGALDVFLTPVIMKKQRPGTKLTVLAKEKLLEEAMDIILSETTTIGVRFSRWGRMALRREAEKIRTEFGPVTFKKVFDSDGILRMYPEYDDCTFIANKKGIVISEVYERLRKYTKKDVKSKN